MTAEIAVLNKSAVALAADSKVTIGSSRNKTYDTVNKLFTLSKIEPVGIMVYGNAAFMEIPWESVVKLYRKELADYAFDTIAEYADDFLTYLPDFFPFGTDAERDNATEIIRSWFRQISSRFQYRLQYSDVNSEGDAKQVLEDVIDEYANFFSEVPVWRPTRAISEKRIATLYGDLVRENVQEIFGKLVKPRSSKLLHKIGLACLLSSEFSDRRSGFVIAGFGDKELFPTAISFELDGIVDRRLKYKGMVHSDISRANCAAIIPFAQDDMVYRFMEGIDREYEQYLSGLIDTVFHQGAQAIVDKYLNTSKKKLSKIKKEVKGEIERLLESAKQHARNYRHEKFVHSIMETLVILPKEELANLAESLVSLTSLQRRVTRDAESVGGPIDVAIISKGDGFIWIKRKHYFDASRNPSFFSNYFRDIDGGGS